MKLSRDPALYAGLAAALIQLVSALIFPLSAAQQAGLNAVVVALAGLVTAFWVRRDGQAAAVIGCAQAVISAALYFGLKLSPEGQAAIMAVITTAAAMFIRTQVTAKVNADGDRQM